jgi:hypothetical protein
MLEAGRPFLLDALAPLGIEHIDMPATRERVWRAIRSARRRPETGRPGGGSQPKTLPPL